MNIFFRRNRKDHGKRHDSLLHELAMQAMEEHKPHRTHPDRVCQLCGQQWPCPGYQLGQAAEIQARSYTDRNVLSVI